MTNLEYDKTKSSSSKDISRRRNSQRKKAKRTSTTKPNLLRLSSGHLHHLYFLLTTLLCIFTLFDNTCIGVVALAAPKTVSQARRQRSVEKARAKVKAFVLAAKTAASSNATATNAMHPKTTTTRPSVLVVDGNNVRGIGQCEWSPVEWMERVSAFCRAYQVDHHVVVWDHGPSPIAMALPSHSNNNNKPQESNTNSNLQNLCLFAGLSQRADDVMVHEAHYLREYYYSSEMGDGGDQEGADDTPGHTKTTTDNFHNFCFITNDGGLQGRLQRLGSDPRLRVLNPNGPLVLDATRFIALVHEVPLLLDCHDNNNNNNNNNTQESAFLNNGNQDVDLVHQSVYRAEEQLQAFFAAKDSSASSRRNTRKYNPKREQTWQRCVLADAMVRGYADQYQQQQQQQQFPHFDSDTNGTLDASSCSYILEAARHRGFHTLSQIKEHSSTSFVVEESGMVVAGSMRLDKKQKRVLARYNKMWTTNSQFSH